MKERLTKIIGLFCWLALCSQTSFAADVQFHLIGIAGDALKNTQNRLQVLKNNTNVQQFYQQAPENIQQALAPYGFFKPIIHSSLTKQNNQWIADFTIAPGMPIKISAIDVAIIGPGKNNAHLQSYLAQFPLKTNQTLNTPNYEKAKQALFTIALEEGYLTAYFVKQEVLVSLKTNRCVIHLLLNTEPQFYFGPVHFDPTPLDDNFLHRYITFKTGSPYSAEKLQALQNALSSTNYFKNVSISSPTYQAVNHNVPVTVHLQMQKAQQYLFGIGYGTDTGPRLTIGNHWRYINAEGHYINSQMVISPVQSSLQASYVIPGVHPSTDQYSLNAAVTQNRLNQGSSRTEQIGASDVTLFANQWQRTLSLNYAIEQFQFNNEPAQNSYLLIPGLSFSKTQSNNRLFPTQGNRFLLSMQGSSYFCGISDNQFFQTEMQEKYITHFTDNDRLILRTDIGYSAIRDFTAFPLSLRFYAGGTQSVRGFAYQSLGPGRYLAIGSAEFQQRIAGNFYGAIFFDTGNAMDHWDTPLARSAGAGIVWASPVGTLELTLAKAISLSDEPLRVQFTMGADL